MKPLIGAGSLASRAADPEEELIARLSTLAPALDGEPDPEWQARTRARLVAVATVRTPEPAPGSPLRRALARREGRPALWRTRLTAGLAGAAAAVVSVAGAVTVSADAEPGDALYGLKRGTEQTQLALAGEARGRTLLGFASTRLDELASLLDDDPSADLVADTLDTMDTQTVDGAAWLAERAVQTDSSGPLDELTGWSGGQATGLAGLQPRVPAGASDDVGSSVDLLTRIAQRAQALRTALDCPTGPVTEGSDALGPVPGACAAAAPAPPAVGDDPSAPVPDQPAPATATAPVVPSEEFTPPDPGQGSGSGPGSGSDSGSSAGPGPDSGSGPGSVVPTPSPGLPTLFPGPEGTVRPPAPGTAAPTAPSAGAVPLPGVGVCVPPLPVIGTC